MLDNAGKKIIIWSKVLMYLGVEHVFSVAGRAY